MSAQPAQPAPSKKEEKPTLAGVNVKTRKRNVAVPLDPAKFANDVLSLFVESCKDKETVSDKLAAAGKALDTSNLDFSRYGSTLFEIYFAGARMGNGAKLADDTKQQLDWNILACKPEVEEILPFIKAFHNLVRRRPFLVQRLEEVLKKLLTSFEFFDDAGRHKIAISTALIFSEKLGVLPEHVFESLFNDRLVAKGTVLSAVTDIFKIYIALRGPDELIALLTRAKVVSRMLEFFPPGQQTEEAFREHFQQHGLDKLVEWQSKKIRENSVSDLQAALMEAFSADEGPEAYAALVAEKRDSVPAEERVRVIWTVFVKSLNTVGKNQLQIQQMILRSIKANQALLVAETKSAKVELALLNCIQVTCYEDSKLLKIFVDIVKALYELDILGEDTINFWYKKGSVNRGRNVFVNDIAPFIKWLDEAEEDEDGEEEEEE